MKTSAELVDDLKRVISEMENDSLAAHEYTGLLCVLTAGPDAETAMLGIHRLMLEVWDHARCLKEKQDEAWQIVTRLSGSPEGSIKCA
jgi:hypothetical protein